MTARGRRPGGKALARLLIQVGVVAIVVALVVWRLDWDGITSAFRVHSWAFLTLALAANGASALFKGVAWKSVVDGLPGMRRPAKYRELIGPLFVGLMVNTLLAARIGEVARSVLAARRLRAKGADVRTSAILGSAIVESIAATIVWVVYVVLIGLLLPLPRYAWFAALIIGAICMTVVISSLFGRGRRMALARRIVPGRARGALGRIWAAIREGNRGLGDSRRLGGVLLGSGGGLLLQWLAVWAVLRAFGLDHVGWGGAALLLVTITIAQAFPVLPGNLVTFQAAAILPLVASYNVATATALAFAVVLQASQAAVGVGVGFICLLAEGMTMRSLRLRVELEQQTESGTTTKPL
ncbi:MAG: glycosyltransferase 2 family protein [Miltoncostaeaceae bacterium]|nr:glycosyltransferase 2 family protein [Miltoncostaeaceae bacterium]